MKADLLMFLVMSPLMLSKWKEDRGLVEDGGVGESASAQLAG